jgi:alkylation response protein AidB-like acyl-CoA dehydrogenase
MPFTMRHLVPGQLLDVTTDIAARGSERLRDQVGQPAESAALEELWRSVAGLGLASMLIPRESGGDGGSLADLAAVIEGCARFALPLPVLAAYGIAPLMILSPANRRRAELAAQFAQGSVTICPVVESPGSSLAEGPPRQPSCQADGHGISLKGEVHGAEAVPGATHYLIACQVQEAGGPQPGLVLVPADGPGLSAVSGRRIDGRNTVDLLFDATSLDGDALLGAGPPVRQAVARARVVGALLTSVEAVAALGALIEETITYLSGREQFGVRLSTFQVLRHHVVDMYVSYENLHALASRSLRQAVAGGGVPLASVAQLKFYLARSGRTAAEAAIQCHGGMGLTEELLAARLAKRVVTAGFEYGDGMFHAERLLADRREPEVSARA